MSDEDWSNLEAYKECEKVSSTWQSGQLKYVLQGRYNGILIEMWYNTATKTIETAYPK